MGLSILLFGFRIGWAGNCVGRVEADWMAIEAVEVVGLVEEQDWVVGKMDKPMYNVDDGMALPYSILPLQNINLRSGKTLQK